LILADCSQQRQYCCSDWSAEKQLFWEYFNLARERSSYIVIYTF